MSKKQRTVGGARSDRILTCDVLSFLNSHDLICGLGLANRGWKTRIARELFTVCHAWAPRGRPPGGYLTRFLQSAAAAPHVIYCLAWGWSKSDYEAAHLKFCNLRGAAVGPFIAPHDESLTAAWLEQSANSLRTVQSWLGPSEVNRVASNLPTPPRMQRVILNFMLGKTYKLEEPTLLRELDLTAQLDFVVSVQPGQQPATVRAADLIQIQGPLLQSKYQTKKAVRIWFVSQSVALPCAEWMPGPKNENDVLLEEATFGTVSFAVHVQNSLFG